MVFSQLINYLSRIRTLLEICILALLLAATITGIVLWRDAHLRVLSVESQSMSPTLKQGDVVLVNGTGRRIIVGDVISYRSPVNPRVTITHRVVALDPTGHMVTTKGDGTSVTDPPFSQSLIIGRVEHKVALLGYTLDFLRTPFGLAVGIYLPALAVLVMEFQRLMAYFRRSRYQLHGYKT